MKFPYSNFKDVVGMVYLRTKEEVSAKLVDGVDLLHREFCFGSDRRRKNIPRRMPNTLIFPFNWVSFILGF